MNSLVQKEDNRNYGIDLLKMFSMFLVVLIHINMQGGVATGYPSVGVGYWGCNFIEALGIICVNLFALASGYVSVKSKFKFKRYILLWLRVFLYSVAIYGFFMLFTDVLVSDVIREKIFSPVLNREYWYFTAYTGVFFMIPIYNYCLNRFNKYIMGSIVAIILILFSGVTYFMQQDIFFVGHGYSFLWLSTLYLVGGYIRLYHVGRKVKTPYLLLIYLFSATVTFFVTYIGFYQPHLTYIKDLWSYSYNTVPNLIGSVALMIAFTRIKITNPIFKKIAILGGATSFSVYIMHVHPLVWDHLMRLGFRFINEVSQLLSIFYMILVALLMYIALSIIDLLRHYLFKWIKIDEGLSILEDKIGLSNKINQLIFKKK